MTTSYTASIVVPVNLTEKRGEQWLDALADYSPAVGRTERNRSEITISFPAKDMSQAVRTGWQLLHAAAGTSEPGSFRVLTSYEYDREVNAINAAPLPSLVSVTEAAERIGVQRQRVQQLIDAGQVPAVRAGSTWALPVYAVDQYIAERDAKAGTMVDASDSDDIALPGGN